MQIIFMEKERC